MVKRIQFAKGRLGPAILIIVLVALAASRLPLEAQIRNGLSGLVRNASGQPVEGGLVRVYSAELGLTFMVVTHAQGRYSTPNLLPGKYTVEGIGGDYQSNPPGRSRSVAAGRKKWIWY